MNGSILVKIRPINDGQLLELITTDREHGRSQRFFTKADPLQNLVIGVPGGVLDTDLENVLQIYKYGNRYVFKLYWLKADRAGTISGYKQTFQMDEPTFMQAAFGEPVVKLIRETEGKAEIIFSESAQHLIKNLTALQRNGLRKFMRDNFKWDGSKITVYADGPRDFFFREDGGICGGIIWSEYSKTYGMHT